MIEFDFEKDYKDIDSLSIKQNGEMLDMPNFSKGDWKLIIPKNTNGLYFYNPLYISQVYSDKKFYSNTEKLDIYLNSSKRLKNEIKIENPKIKIYENGFSILNKLEFYASAFFNDIVGMMIIYK